MIMRFTLLYIILLVCVNASDITTVRTDADSNQPTCSDIKSVYNIKSCCPSTKPVNMCGNGTLWSGQKCQIIPRSNFRYVQSYKSLENITVHMPSTHVFGDGWHTCTCADGSTYECKSKHGDGAACCDRSMPAICGEGNVDMGGYQLVTNSSWHTCTCADGSTYECQSNQGDGAACCDRSMPAICGEDNVGANSITDASSPTTRGSVTGNGWHTCTCADGSTYECKSNRGDGAACCDRSMPAICGNGNILPSNTMVSALASVDLAMDVVYDIPRVISKDRGWHTCTCADGSTYECKSNYGDGAACCERSKTAICGSQPVWRQCTCDDGSSYQCKMNNDDTEGCCARTKPVICGPCQVTQCATWDCQEWCKCFDSKINYGNHGCSSESTSCSC